MLFGLILGSTRRVAHQIGFVLGQFQQPHTSQSLHDGRNVAVGQRQCLQHLGIDAKVVEVGTYGYVHLWISLTDDSYDGSAFFRFANERHARLSSNQDG